MSDSTAGLFESVQVYRVQGQNQYQGKSPTASGPYDQLPRRPGFLSEFAKCRHMDFPVGGVPRPHRWLGWRAEADSDALGQGDGQVGGFGAAQADGSRAGRGRDDGGSLVGEVRRICRMVRDGRPDVVGV